MPGRRPLVALVALFVVPLPACLHTSAPTAPTPDDTKDAKQVAKTDPAPPRLEFASLPRIPGTLVRLTGNTNTSANPTQSVGPAPKPSNPPPTGPVALAGGNMDTPIFPIAPAPDPPLLAVVRAYVENHPDRAIELLRTLDKPNQDFVLTAPARSRAGRPAPT